ncbi:MAG: FG-GAP repeat protein, partial [Planctomycetes bacterium]|nr:FG-GAP repeat protein [Planctomycetota bacterium]
MFGACVAGVGDVNGDRRPDILIGAPGDQGAGREAGSVAVFSGADGSLIHLLQGAGPLGRFGSAACGLGDLDGDGYDDFAVGAPGAGAQEQGSVVIYSGASGALLRIENGARPGAAFGASLAFAGDLDGDGFGDWLAGAPLAGSGRAPALSGRSGSLPAHLVAPAPAPPFGPRRSGPRDPRGGRRRRLA